jgi:hypothetical protein
VIEAEQVQNRRVQIVDVDFVLRRVETEFARLDGSQLAEISWIRSDFHFFPPPAGRNSLNGKPRIF